MVLCTKLDDECDRQAAVIGRLLTTLGDDRRGVRRCEIILSSEVGEMLQGELRLIFDILEFRICSIKILQLQGALPLDQKL